MDALIFNTLERVQAEQDEAKREELKAETNEELAAHFSRHTDDMEELAFDLLNLAWGDATATDIVRQLIEVKTVGLGDPDYVEENLRGMRAYWQGKGGQIRSDILRYERSQMPREEIVAAIDMHQDELQLNFWGSFDKLSTQARDKMALLPSQRLVELIQLASLDPNVPFGTFAAATLTDTNVDSILDPVALKAGGQVSIVGTSVAIRKLANVGLDFGPNLQERIFQTGQIATYKGYPIVQVENFENFEGNFVLPNDELWIIGRNAGRLTYYGAQAKVQQLKLPSFWFRWETARDAGMLLYGAGKGRVGRIVLT
jgi:hypothetical protein